MDDNGRQQHGDGRRGSKATDDTEAEARRQKAVSVVVVALFQVVELLFGCFVFVPFAARDMVGDARWSGVSCQNFEF